MMRNKKVLLTAFRGTSAELLLQGVGECEILLLPNDKVKDSKLLIDMIAKAQYDYIISFGQKPNIRNKVHIETTARKDEFQIHTAFDCEELKRLFEQTGITAIISHNAGTSFCNELYLNGLRYIVQENLKTQMVFIHIPFTKNITEIEDFQQKILEKLK